MNGTAELPRLQRVNSHVEITVSDTGEGISAEFLSRLFQRFQPAELATVVLALTATSKAHRRHNWTM